MTPCLSYLLLPRLRCATPLPRTCTCTVPALGPDPAHTFQSSCVLLATSHYLRRRCTSSPRDQRWSPPRARGRPHPITLALPPRYRVARVFVCEKFGSPGPLIPHRDHALEIPPGLNQDVPVYRIYRAFLEHINCACHLRTRPQRRPQRGKKHHPDACLPQLHGPGAGGRFLVCERPTGRANVRAPKQCVNHNFWVTFVFYILCVKKLSFHQASGY